MLQGAALNVLLISIALGVTASQTLIKFAASAYRASGLVTDPAFLFPLTVAFAVSTVVQLVWMWTLQFVPLGQGYMAMALTFVFVPLVSWRLFAEPLSIRYVVGATLIIVGVSLTVRN